MLHNTERLYALYRIFTLKHRVEINNLDTFIKHLYIMDIMWLNTCFCPFIWEDYIFIDDNLIIDFIIKNNSNPILNDPDDFDHLCLLDNEFVAEIVSKKLIDTFSYSLPINHLDHIPNCGKSYYKEIKENYYLFDNDYNSLLLIKRREVSLNNLLN